VTDFDDMLAAVMRLERQLVDVSNRVDRMFVVGPVAESEHGKGVRIRLNPDDDGEPHLSPWLQHADASGASSYRPKKDEQVLSLNPHGDLRQGIVIPVGHSDAKPNPAADGEETVHFNRDGVRFSSRDGVFTVKCKKVVLEVEGASYTLDSSGHLLKGEKVKHDEKNIGKDHKHNGVETGPSQTKEPV
jgi:phage baseplate assembly protein gpV